MERPSWHKVLQRDSERQESLERGTVDRRPLYERLLEQRTKGDNEYLEKLKESNKTATLNEEDIKHLEGVEHRKRQHEAQLLEVERAMLADFKKKRELVRNQETFSLEPRLSLEPAAIAAKSFVQKKRSNYGIAPRRKAHPSDNG